MTDRKTNRIISLLVASLLLFTMSLYVFAGDSITVDLSQKGSISLFLSDKETGEAIRGKKFSLYRVASAYTKADSIAYTFVAEFAQSGISLLDKNADNLPLHLAYYAKSKNLPHMEKYTDANGRLTFTDLEAGLYLVVSEDVASNPFLVSIPEFLNGEWSFNLDASPKIEGDIDTDERNDITAEKKWKGDNHPESITVVLLRDGKEYDEEILSAENDWKITWENLSKNYAWAVVEKNVPSGFEASYETYGRKTVITNSRPGEEETTTSPDDTTDYEDTTAQEDTTSPDDITSPDGTTDPQKTTKPQGSTVPTSKGETTTKEQLADTGQLNWPVPVLAALGIVLFSTGWAMLNLKKEEAQG